jgi:Bacterial PH domain
MRIFSAVPVGSKTMWWGIVVVLLVGIAGASILVMARAPTFDVSAAGLRISGNPFGRMIPAADLRLGAARVVDFTRSPDLRPKWRTMGLGLPGYKAGWFRLSDGEKALVFLSGAKPALYIPTTAGYSLLISTQDPDGLLSSLRAAAH